jgi:hypothetical protein
LAPRNAESTAVPNGMSGMPAAFGDPVDSERLGPQVGRRRDRRIAGRHLEIDGVRGILRGQQVDGCAFRVHFEVGHGDAGGEREFRRALVVQPVGVGHAIDGDVDGHTLDRERGIGGDRHGADGERRRRRLVLVFVLRLRRRRVRLGCVRRRPRRHSREAENGGGDQNARTVSHRSVLGITGDRRGVYHAQAAATGR